MSNADFLQSPFTIGGIIGVLGSVITKLYLDGKTQAKADKDTIQQISQARVDDLKELNASKDGTINEVKTLVGQIYNKLEAEKKK